MNTDLQELIETAKKLCKNLEDYALEEQKRCEDLQNTFEKMSWDIHCMTEELKIIKRFKELEIELDTEYQFHRQVG